MEHLKKNVDQQRSYSNMNKTQTNIEKEAFKQKLDEARAEIYVESADEKNEEKAILGDKMDKGKLQFDDKFSEIEKLNS